MCTTLLYTCTTVLRTSSENCSGCMLGVAPPGSCYHARGDRAYWEQWCLYPSGLRNLGECRRPLTRGVVRLRRPHEALDRRHRPMLTIRTIKKCEEVTQEEIHSRLGSRKNSGLVPVSKTRYERWRLSLSSFVCLLQTPGNPGSKHEAVPPVKYYIRFTQLHIRAGKRLKTLPRPRRPREKNRSVS